jgi:hypothetical protein
MQYKSNNPGDRPMINLVSVGDVYTAKEAHGIKTEAWVFDISDRPENQDAPRYYDCLVTVEQGSSIIASRIVSVPEYALTRIDKTGFQAVEELGLTG